MMEYQDARNMVSDFIKNRTPMDIETDFGWVFPYNSKKFLEKNELIYALVGNAPIIFDNRDESIHVTGTSHNACFYINHHIHNYRPNPNPS